MDSPQLFFAFGAIMLVMALLGVALDWFGKPLRHRRFVPKVYRFPDERQPRHSQVRQTEWSDASLILPVAEPPNAQLVRYPDASTAGAVGAANAASSAPSAPLPRDVGPPTAQVPVVGLVPGIEGDDQPIVTLEELSGDTNEADDPLSHIVTLEDVGESHDADGADVPVGTDDEANGTGTATESVDAEASADDAAAVEQATPPAQPETSDVSTSVDAANGDQSERPRGWNAGQYIFNLTNDGNEPSPATVRTRYWKNVASTAGAAMFGQDNVDRMASGKAPRRLNHRSGKSESMRLPTVGYHESGGNTPVPQWPVNEVDPFA
ncbi:MAG: hypothetical protein ACR2PK_17435 [Acidimicrobiales bacterium]